MIDWRIDAVTFGNCNCDLNCPCQFELYPTQGHCNGFEIGKIETGISAISVSTGSASR